MRRFEVAFLSQRLSDRTVVPGSLAIVLFQAMGYLPLFETLARAYTSNATKRCATITIEPELVRK